MAKSLVELASKIAVAQASVKPMNAEEMAHALRTVHATLVGLQAMESGTEGSEAVEVPVDPNLAKLREKPGRSIQKNAVICLECGDECKVLGKVHLQGHGLTPKEYRKKWGLGARQALVSKTLSENRKETAERLKLGERLAAGRGKRTPEVNLIKGDTAPKKTAAKKKGASKKK